MSQILFHTSKAWQFKYYGRNAPYHASHCDAWNSSSLPLGPPVCEDSAALLSENLSSLQVGGLRADDADQQEFTDQTDDTWSGLRHGRQRNQIHLNSLKQLIPLLATSAASSPTNPPWFGAQVSVLTSTRAGRVPQASASPLVSQPRYYNHFFLQVGYRWQSARPVPFDMDPFSLLFLIAALVFLSLGLGALCHYILLPYLRCVLWVRANFNQDTNNTCWV